MDDNGCVRDVFATDELWKPSSFFEDPFTQESTLFAPIELDLPSIQLDHPYAPKGPLDKALQLPDLESFKFEPFPELDSLEPSTISTDTPQLDEQEEDIWRLALESGPANKDLKFFSWEAFENPDHVEKRSPYIAESGTAALDAALASHEGKLTAKIIKRQSLLSCLWNLGLGRSSLLFQLDTKSSAFVQAIDQGRASGLSLPASQSIVKQFLRTGNLFVYLRSFIERTFASPTSISTKVALATCVSSILSTFEDYLGTHSNEITSLLQLQQLFAKPRVILAHVGHLVDALKNAKTNEHLSSLLHHIVLGLEGGDEVLCRLSAEILRRVAQPCLELIGEWIGTQRESSTTSIEERGSFVLLADGPDSPDPREYTYRSEMMPRFISPEDGNTIFETGNSLRFLKLHHPEHPLACPEKFGLSSPRLDWEFGWQAIEDISSKAKSYEESLRTAIKQYSQTTEVEERERDNSRSTRDNNIVEAEPDFQQYIEESAQLFDQDPQQTLDFLPDELRTITADILTGSDAKSYSEPESRIFAPPTSITSTLSFRPLLLAQAKIVNATTLRLFFRSHNLRKHLSLQRQYHLLNDGVFSSRLASALFDPERETAERQKGTMRSGVQMGLQLGARTEWPPASSELRLALMGVLSEAYHSSALYHSTLNAPDTTDAPFANNRDKDELPGQLNFSIRQLTEPEMEKIMDPDSLYALDFLRLQYVPPSPLNLVITTSALDKYDTIFKFLLRLLRMLFVVSHLPRTYPSSPPARRFRTEAHHFVTALSTYIFQTGIAEHWTTFETYISMLEQRLREEDAAGELGTRVTSGLESIKAAHEQCLDGIMFSLLLRRRQKKVLALLEDIFECILLFAKTHRPEASSGKETKAPASVDEEELYANLKGKIRVFISVCRGLTGKKGYGKGRGTGEENTIERLVTVLEMNSYYSR
ncbi:hypothetical protein BU24DRAFT_399704 [Aaosphaeria arxii CBS 175.79]|uniref:Spindle pole body component n=1 Tax=Aaosphaeria arxii CBS 175.79 TaxID=1450172 RepID=A0A6A5XBU5_9PLEO|nr:uncharacterized protein BU24DRAFT_399704 [Aaosphaeria arxii CBS 175.79]KAF2010391.1 hypothetical protein BU24DRAFT_399704 [Aaosphaeria arxii CBS 175.79]